MKNTGSNSFHNNVKRCSYFLLGMPTDNFIKLGGQQIDDTNSYYIEKKYDGTPTGEVCAVLGVNKKDLLTIYNYMVSNEEDESSSKNYLNHHHDYNKYSSLTTNEKTVIDKIKEFSEFKKIDKIDFINIKYIENAIKYFYNSIINFDDDYVFILNIEPRGETKRQLKFYPNPNLCIPGGNMEYKDNLSFEKCAIREFEEETGIKIPNYKIIDKYNVEIIKKYIKNGNKYKEGSAHLRESFSFPSSTSFKRFDLTNSKNIKHERQYFLVTIV